MPPDPVTAAFALIERGLDALAAAAGPRASDPDLVRVLTGRQDVARMLDLIDVRVIAALARRGRFSGYHDPAPALEDLLGSERADARRRALAAATAVPRVGVNGTPLRPELEATAEVFAARHCGLGHVEVIATLLRSRAARRLDPAIAAGAEADLAEKATLYSVAELRRYGTALIDALDSDGAQPDDPPRVNELRLGRLPGGGGTLKGRFTDAALFDAIATAVDATAKPIGADDPRSLPTRQAEALADLCGYALDHADTQLLPASGGRRPHLNVTISLEDLEARARAALLDFGGTLTPAALRALCCDAAVVPIVLDGAGQPLDVGRAQRTATTAQRRAVTVRDRGCARCGKPPSWCEIHHIHPWECGGETNLDNLVMLCKSCHRLIHHTDWDVRITNGVPEFLPPHWITPDRIPRPSANLVGALVPA